MEKTCKLCKDKLGAGEKSTFSRLDRHLVNRHKMTKGEAMAWISTSKLASRKSNAGRTRFICQCGIVVVRKAQHLESTSLHPELAGKSKTSVEVKLAMRAFKTYYKPATCATSTDACSANQDEPLQSVSGCSKSYLSRDVVLKLKKNDKVMVGFSHFSIVDSWGAHLGTRFGGKLDEGQISTATTMISRYLALAGYDEERSGEEEDLSRHFQAEGCLDIYDTYMVGTFTPGTVRSSLTYLNKFVEFLNSRDKLQKYAKIKNDIKSLMSSSRKDDLDRTSERRRIETAQLPTDDVTVVASKFRKSDYVTQTIERFMEGDLDLVWDVRGILIQTMAFENGSRCGEFTNLAYKHVLSAAPFEGGFTIDLDRHKTAQHYRGFIHVGKETYKVLKRFVRVTKTKESTEDDLVFKSSSGGQQTDSNYVNRWLKSAWKKAGMEAAYPSYNPTLTGNRKLVTTSSRRRDNSKAEAVAQMLCHRKTTADRYYSLEDSRKKSQTTFSWVIGADKEQGKKVEEEKEVEEEEVEEEVEEEDDKIKETTMEEDEEDRSVVLNIKGKTMWTKDEEEEAIMLFSGEIDFCLRTNKSFPRYAVDQRRGDRLSRFTENQIREKLRNIVKKLQAKKNYRK